MFKSLTDAFSHKALNFYGLNTAPIVRAEKTELPRIEVKETRMDFVFLLEDDTTLHLEFQTAMNREDLEQFLKYDVALYESKRRVIHTAVICGKDIHQAPVRLDHGSVQYNIEAVYMNRYDGDRIAQELKEKVQTQDARRFGPAEPYLPAADEQRGQSFRAR